MADLIGPFNVEEEEVRGRVFEVIEALWPDPFNRPDMREGSLVWTLTAPFIKEVLRFYSDLNETLLLGFLQTTRAEFLDSKGLEVGLDRKGAAAAAGKIRFLGAQGIVIPAGTTVSTAADTEEEDIVAFSVDAVDGDNLPIPTSARTLVGIDDPDTPPVLNPSLTATTVNGNVLYRYTYLTKLSEQELGFGETAGSPTSAPVMTVSNGAVEVIVPPAPSHSGLYEIIGINIYRALDTGSGFSKFKLLTTIAGDLTTGPITYLDQISNADFGIILETLPSFNSTAYVDVAGTALEDGRIGNIFEREIQFLDDTITGVTKVTNPEVFSGGADIEEDDEYRERLLDEIRKPPGAGNVADYEGWAKSIIGVESAHVIPEWEAIFGLPNGPGTVKVIISGPDNTLVGPGVIENVRQYIAGDVAIDSPYDYLGGSTAPGLTAVSATGGQVPDGIYEYVYTFVNVGGGETPHNAIKPDGSVDDTQILTVTVNTGTGTSKVQLSDVAQGPGGTGVENTTKRRIYRRAQISADPRFFLVGEIPNNTSQTFTDVAASGSLRYAPTVNSTSLFNGQAPIGAHVTIESISKLSIKVEAVVVPEPGYNLLGTGGNINLGDLIRDSLNDFISGLAPGETIYFVDIENAIHDTVGVKDFRNVVVFTPDFPFGTTQNIFVPDETIKPIFDPSGVLVEAAV